MAEEIDVIDKFIIEDHDSEMEEMTPVVVRRRETLNGKKTFEEVEIEEEKVQDEESLKQDQKHKVEQLKKNLKKKILSGALQTKKIRFQG